MKKEHASKRITWSIEDHLMREYVIRGYTPDDISPAKVMNNV
jgi:hypothetical protein